MTAVVFYEITSFAKCGSSIGVFDIDYQKMVLNIRQFLTDFSFRDVPEVEQRNRLKLNLS